jgi:hypothetical protein
MKREADYNFHKTSKLGFILSQTIPIHTIISNFNINFISVLSAHLRLGCHNEFFLSILPTKIVYKHFSSDHIFYKLPKKTITAEKKDNKKVSEREHGLQILARNPQRDL